MARRLAFCFIARGVPLPFAVPNSRIWGWASPRGSGSECSLAGASGTRFSAWERPAPVGLDRADLRGEAGPCP